MSLRRQIFYCAALCGWGAFLGWLLSEYALQALVRQLVSAHLLQVAMSFALVGSGVTLGLAGAAGLSDRSRLVWSRLLTSLVAGFVLWTLCSLVAQLLYQLGVPRALAWLLVGLCIGGLEGLLDGSVIKLRNGLLGGAVGGLIGGLAFDPIVSSLGTGHGMMGRATGFTIMGVCIGLLIGLVQVVLKQAWLTVVDGAGTGRQLILSQPVTVLGRAEHLPLSFRGPSNAEIEPKHASITRQANGTYVLEDNQTKLGTLVNAKRLQEPYRLCDGDIIRVGSTLVRFNERLRSRDANQEAVPASAAPSRQVAPPPPPPRVSARPSEAAPAAASPGPRPAGASLPPRPAGAARPAPPAPRPAPAAPPPRPAGSIPPPPPIKRPPPPPRS